MIVTNSLDPARRGAALVCLSLGLTVAALRVECDGAALCEGQMKEAVLQAEAAAREGGGGVALSRIQVMIVLPERSNKYPVR